jgi:hypothetical protein
VHSTGEMTNPLPIEEKLLARCTEHVRLLCVFGQRLPTPMLVLQARDGVSAEDARVALLKELPGVNASSPGYSQIAARHVFVVDTTTEDALPTSAKGNVIRSAVEKRFAQLAKPPAPRTGPSGSQLQVRIGTEQLIGIMEALLGDTLDADTPAMDAGFDSILIQEFANQLQELTNAPLPATLIFDYPTPRMLSGFLSETAPLAAARPLGQAHVAGVLRQASMASLSATLPGGAVGPKPLLEVALSGSDLVADVPVGRWEMDPSGAPATRHGAFMRGAELFDNSAFRISPAESSRMDPCHRMLLEHSYEALSATGMDRVLLAGGASSLGAPCVGACV